MTFETAATSGWKALLEQNRASALDELVELLRIPSVSTAQEHVPDVLRAADWVAARLTRAGFENVGIFPTSEHACVYADWIHAPGKPTVLIYGHFDVQPADPLALWESPPFEPVISEGRIVARGAADMKGNLLLSILGPEALLKAEGALPVNVKFLFEGQEEIGSRDLQPFVSANADRLACDLVLCVDGGQWAVDQPLICLGVKGACAMQVDLETAAMDLHSGLYGGAIPNAVHALAQLIASLRDSDGLIAVEGFFDQVVPLTDAERELINAVPFDEAEYRAPLGVDALVGEPGYTTYERAGSRPTLELNGIWGGYQGEGVKTIIPAQAHAKISCRLVANQEPSDVLDAVEAHLRRNCPPGARLRFIRSGLGARSYSVPATHPAVRATVEVLEEVYGRTPYYVKIGGSLPIMDMFLRELEAETIGMGFGQSDERIHSPNEFFRLDDFERGQMAVTMFLQRLATLTPEELAVDRR